MSRMSEHLAVQVHKALAEQNRKLAKGERTKAALSRTLHKEAGLSEDTESTHSKMADACDEQANVHDQAAEHHLAAMEACMKAQADFLNKIVPDDVRGIVPPYPGLTAIPRAGAPPMGSGQRPNVDPQFAHLVEIDDQ